MSDTVYFGKLTPEGQEEIARLYRVEAVKKEVEFNRVTHQWSKELQESKEQAEEMRQAYERAIQALFYSGKYDELTAVEFRERLGVPEWFKQDTGKQVLNSKEQGQ